MPRLIYFSVRFVFRLLLEFLLFALTCLRRVYDFILDFNFWDIIMASPRPIPVSPRPAENNAPQDLYTTVLANRIEDTSSAQKGPEENVENRTRNTEQEDNNDENSLASKEQQSVGHRSSSNVALNTNEENAQEENQNNDEMIVATLACILECCDMCQIL